MTEPDRPGGAGSAKRPPAAGTEPGPNRGAAEHQLFGKPLDPALLEETAPTESKPFPARAVALVVVPFGALAAATGAQWMLDGPAPNGDAALRWLLWGAGLGLLLGAGAGLGLAANAGGRLFWAAWGLCAPVALAGLVAGGSVALRPLREWEARRSEAKCRQTRTVCTTLEFRAACEKAAEQTPGARQRGLALLGKPATEICDQAGCTFRWLYTGPWTPDDWVSPGSLLCSVVADQAGRGLRHALNPGTEPTE